MCELWQTKPTGSWPFGPGMAVPEASGQSVILRENHPVTCVNFEKGTH